MSSISLSLTIESPSDTEKNVFTVLNDYLQSSSISPASAAEGIDRLKPVSTDKVESFLWETWNIFIAVARQVPSGDTAQDKLVDVIKALGEIPPVTVQIWGSDIRLWADQPLLGSTLREVWNPPEFDRKTTEQEATEWVNLNSFAARLLTISPSLTLYAIWMLRAALEEKSSGPQLENNVAVALQWIKYGGDILYRQSQISTAEEERSTAGGPLYTGPGKLCAERWAFWKERLAQIGQEEAKVALQGKEIMDGVEGV